jgi:protein tyrosine phosphatase
MSKDLQQSYIFTRANLNLFAHCSDGVGRTGSFICIHSQLERLKTEGVVDFFQGAKSARIQRAGLIPDDVCM